MADEAAEDLKSLHWGLATGRQMESWVQIVDGPAIMMLRAIASNEPAGFVMKLKAEPDRTIFKSPKRWVVEAHKGRAITIIVLGDLNSDNGLPGFGDPPKYCSLQSGQALHALADAPQNSPNAEV